MKPALTRVPGRQRGVAAIELALALAACAVLAPVLLSVGSVFLHYAALHKAVHEGARYVAALPPQALGTDAAATQAVTAARAMVAATAQQAGLPVILRQDRVVVLCDVVTCDGALPATVTVSAAVTVPLASDLFRTGGDGELHLQAAHTMRYGYATN